MLAAVAFIAVSVCLISAALRTAGAYLSLPLGCMAVGGAAASLQADAPILYRMTRFVDFTALSLVVVMGAVWFGVLPAHDMWDRIAIAVIGAIILIQLLAARLGLLTDRKPRNERGTS